jgi:hypothetical protein
MQTKYAKQGVTNSGKCPIGYFADGEFCMKANESTTKRKQKMKLGYLSLAVLAVATTGCGKKIPDCTDEEVQKLAGQVLKDIVQKTAMKLQDPLRTHFGDQVKVTIETSVENLKLNGISTVKTDKDARVNYCSAMPSAELSRIVKIIPQGQMGAAFLGANLNLLNQDDMKALGEATQLDVSGLAFTAFQQFPQSITYKTNVTDDGKQVLVFVDPVALEQTAPPASFKAKMAEKQKAAENQKAIFSSIKGIATKLIANFDSLDDTKRALSALTTPDQNSPVKVEVQGDAEKVVVSPKDPANSALTVTFTRDPKAEGNIVWKCQAASETIRPLCDDNFSK